MLGSDVFVNVVGPLASDQSDVTIDGEANANETIEILIGGDSYVVTADASGAWSLPLTSLADGSYDVVVIDSAGFVTELQQGLVIDTAPPFTPGSSFVAVTPITTPVTTTSPTISGSGPANTDLVIEVAGRTQVVTTDATGLWSLTISPALVDGSYDIRATTSDGFVSLQTGAILIDTTAPQVPTVNALLTTDTTPILSGTADPNEALTVEVDGVTYTLADPELTLATNGQWTLDLSAIAPLSSATYEVIATSTDSAGNSSSDQTIDELVIDAIAPVVPTVDLLTTNDATPTITGTADPDEVLVVTVNGVSYSSDTDAELTLNPDGSWSLDLSTATPLVMAVMKLPQ